MKRMPTQEDGQVKNVEPAHVEHTQWHRILARLFELLLTHLGVTVVTELPVMGEPPRIDILLIRRDGDSWTEQQLQLLCDGMRDVAAPMLMIEFKYSESLTVKAVRQTVGYDHFYCTGQNLADSEVATFILVARTPRPGLLADLGYEATDLPGVYRTRQSVAARVQIIVINQLRPEMHNSFVQYFASKRRVRNAAFERLQEMGEDELGEAVTNLVFGLRGKFDVKEGEMGKVREREVVTSESLMEFGRGIRQMVIANMGPEERRKVIAKMKPEERLAGLAPEERLAGLAPEELAKLMEQIELYLQQPKQASSE